MTVPYLLDTDTVVDVLRDRHGVAKRLSQLSPDDVAIASMTLAELWYGVHCASDSTRSELAVRRFVEVVRLVPFGRAAAAHHGRVRHEARSRTIRPHDLVIATTALASGATLVTSNAREFERVPGLKVESWR